MPSIKKFKKLIYNHYKAHGRVFPWRTTRDPYKILVSEIMLQQTQAPRVLEKYTSFLKRFPTLKSLAKAPPKSLLQEWQGLGYNRRAISLQKTAQEIVTKHKGVFPKNYEMLLTLPGIGPATAGDLLAFAWNKPAVVIETNIRTVYINYFFPGQQNIPDSDLLPLIKKSLDNKNPRDWYFALMDYGAFLKKTIPNPSRQSKHYTKQSTFRGSNRELRSKILKYLLAYPNQTSNIISESLLASLDNVEKNVTALVKEGLIKEKTVKQTKLYYV